MALDQSKLLAKRIRTVRKSLGLTQAELGKKLGLDEHAASSRINHYEKSRHSPSYDFMLALAKLSDTPVSYFYEPNDLIADTIKVLSTLTEAERVLFLDIATDMKERKL